MWKAAASILLGALVSFAADVTLDQVMTAVRSDVKPQQAMEYMRRVYATDRWFTFPKFQETAEYLKQAMRDAGLENVEVLGAPADGVTHAGYWTEPLAWDVKQARLELIDPGVPKNFACWQTAKSSGFARYVEWSDATRWNCRRNHRCRQGRARAD